MSVAGSRQPTEEEVRVVLEVVKQMGSPVPLTPKFVVALCDSWLAHRKAIQDALNELGVPNGNYPAPVANAVEILAAVVSGTPPE